VSKPPFPKTLSEFQSWFATEDACVRYLAESRWPDGYRCPRCHHDEAYELRSRPLFKCKKCNYQVSVTAGTVLHGTRLSIHDWFSAAYLVATHTPGISAVQLQRQLGLKRYETAWGLLQKLRRAMVRPERDRIYGEVEVGRRGGRLRDSTKTIVVGAVEIRGQGSGRVRLSVVEDLSAASLVGFLEASVTPGSIIHTDGWGGYRPLASTSS
jgi:transposase-like protein